MSAVFLVATAIGTQQVAGLVSSQITQRDDDMQPIEPVDRREDDQGRKQDDGRRKEQNQHGVGSADKPSNREQHRSDQHSVT